MAQNWLKTRLHELGFTQKQLADMIGKDQTVFSRYLTLERAPDPTFLPDMAKALELDEAGTASGLAQTYAYILQRKGSSLPVEDLVEQYHRYTHTRMGPSAHPPDLTSKSSETLSVRALSSQNEHNSNAMSAHSAPILPAPHTVARDFPVYGAAEAGEGDFFEMQDVVDYRGRPSTLAKSTGAYALYVIGDSMKERYEDGELIYVHPGRPVTIGCDVVVQISNGDEVVKAMVKRLVRKTSQEIELRSINLDYDQKIIIQMKDIKAIHRVLRTEELVG